MKGRGALVARGREPDRGHGIGAGGVCVWLPGMGCDTGSGERAGQGTRNWVRGECRAWDAALGQGEVPSMGCSIEGEGECRAGDAALSLV